MKLMDEVLSKDNLNLEYLHVIRNKGASGVDEMTCEEVKDYLKVHGNELINQIKSREYQPLPVRRVEIPKPNGGVRKLGIPTIVDRIIQQALVQKLMPIFEPTFSEYSYGFRPNRRCQNAIDRALELINQGFEWIVDLDLEKFFDNVPQDKLIRLIDNAVNDSDITALIHKYLRAGVMIGGKLEETKVGTPQGGNLSPLLSNIYLNELDKELERRELHFARYADDCVVFVKTKFSAERVMRNITTFIEKKLKLKVNAEKTHITRPNNLKYLGFSFWKDKEFEEVNRDELQARSIKRAEEQERKAERLSKIEEKQSSVFLPPSHVAKTLSVEKSADKPVDMSDRGIDSLTRMDDREVVERASKTRHGTKFSALFNGFDVLGSEEKNERSLMARLAVHTSDKEKLLRIFKASGQYRDEKPNAYYEKLADEELRFVSGLKKQPASQNTSHASQSGRFANAKG